VAWGLSVMLVKVLTGGFDPPPFGVLVALTAAALAAARTSTRSPVEELREL